MEPAGDYLQLSAPQCLCTMLKIYLNNYVFSASQYSESDSIMECSLPGLCTSHFNMTYGSKRQEYQERVKQTHTCNFFFTLIFTHAHLTLNEQVKLIHSHWLDFLLHSCSLFADISAFVVLFSCSADLCRAVTHWPVSLDCKSIVSFQSGSL